MLLVHLTARLDHSVPPDQRHPRLVGQLQCVEVRVNHLIGVLIGELHAFTLENDVLGENLVLERVGELVPQVDVLSLKHLVVDCTVPAHVVQYLVVRDAQRLILRLFKAGHERLREGILVAT